MGVAVSTLVFCLVNGRQEDLVQIARECAAATAFAASLNLQLALVELQCSLPSIFASPNAQIIFKTATKDIEYCGALLKSWHTPTTSKHCIFRIMT